jgi:hypothetical protein
MNPSDPGESPPEPQAAPEPRRPQAGDPFPPIPRAQQLAILGTFVLLPMMFFVSWQVWVSIGGVLAVLAAIARVTGNHATARVFLIPLLGAILLPVTVVVCFYMVCVVK